MSTPNMFWFHCGRCGALFQSKAGDSDTRLCSKCGFNPSIGILEPPADPTPVSEVRSAETEHPEHPERAEHHGKRSVKKRKNRHLMLKLVGGWTLVLALIILGARHFWHTETPDKRPTTTTGADAPVINNDDITLLKENGIKCADAFSAFLAAGTPEQRNQFVLKPVTTASRMARFYGLNPLINLDPQKISLAENAVLDLPDGKAIETRWTSQDGKDLDAVFREENGEWRLDWDHFARYSDYPWSLFLAGSGDPECEFRLLARERQVEERADKDTTVSLVLYAPRFGSPRDTGFQSPEFIVSRNKREGQLLEAAFKLARSGKQVFGSKIKNLNPDDMIRVRLKVRRTEVDGERKFEITEVTACHWYSVDEAGVEPAKPAEEKPPES